MLPTTRNGSTASLHGPWIKRSMSGDTPGAADESEALADGAVGPPRWSEPQPAVIPSRLTATHHRTLRRARHPKEPVAPVTPADPVNVNGARRVIAVRIAATIRDRPLRRQSTSPHFWPHGRPA